MRKRIGLITTINTNIGDDLIREGIYLVLRQVFKGQEVEFILINKHRPMTIYPAWHPSRWTEILPRGKRQAARLTGKLLYRFGFSYFDSCDLIVQCGAPVLWPGCHRAEWAVPLWRQVVGRLSKRIPVLNLAAGSAYPWENQPTRIIDPKDARYLRAILGYCRLTTVRDALAQRLCTSLGTETPLLPCSGFLAGKDYTNKGRGDGVVLINYMSGGGHYEWGQGIDPSAWQKTVKTLINRLHKRHRLAFLCHNKTEYDLAHDLDSTLPRLWPKTPHEYFSLVSEAKVALCNRMHASVGLASLGVPSIAVGTDTRLLMVDALKLPCVYVKEANVGQLEDQLEDLVKNRSQERERLLALQSETWDRYIQVVNEAIQGDKSGS